MIWLLSYVAVGMVIALAGCFWAGRGECAEESYFRAEAAAWIGVFWPFLLVLAAISVPFWLVFKLGEMSAKSSGLPQ